MNGDQVREAVLDGTLGAWNLLWAKVFAFLPNVLGTLVLVAVGYLVAALVRRVGSAVLKRIGFDRASARAGVSHILEQAGVTATPAEIVGQIFFWLLMLTFLVSAAENLGLPNVSQTIDAFVLYLPRVLAAALIVVVGMTLANFVRDLVRSGAESLEVEYARALAAVVHAILVVVVGSLAVGQLQIETVLFNRVVEIVLVAAGVALALAFGLGTRDVARHIVAGVYLRDLYRPGVRLAIGEQEGALEEVGAIATRLRGADGHAIHVPNGRLAESVVVSSASST
jgi:Mechanosensitive ion channel, conserved TM helix/Mechanosensitive ion channel, beta-domain